MSLALKPNLIRTGFFLLLGLALLIVTMWPEKSYVFDIGAVDPPQEMKAGLYSPEQDNGRTFQQSQPSVPLWLPFSSTNLDVNLVVAGNTLTPTLLELKSGSQSALKTTLTSEFRTYHIFIPNEMFFDKVSLNTTPFLEKNSSARTLGIAMDYFSVHAFQEKVLANSLSWNGSLALRIAILTIVWYAFSFLIRRKIFAWFLSVNILLIILTKIFSLYLFNIFIAVAIIMAAIAIPLTVVSKAFGKSTGQARSYDFIKDGIQYNLSELLFWIILSILMTYPLITQLNDVFPDKLDSYLNSWILAWDHHQLWNDPFNLFETNIIQPYPYTLAQSEHLLGLYPITAPLFLLGLPAAMVHNLAMLIGFILCGFGMSILTRLVTGSRVAGIVAGIIYAFYPYRVLQMGHIQQMSAQWMPFTFWALEKFRQHRNWRYAGLSGLFFLLQSLVSYYHAIFLGIMVLIYGVYFLFKDRDLRTLSSLSKLFATAVVIVLVHIPLAQPYLYLQKNLGFQRSASDSLLYSAALTDYLTPYGFNDFYTAQAQIIDSIAPIQNSPEAYLTKWQFISDRPTHETMIFIGIIPLILIGLGIAQWRKYQLVPCLILIASVCIVFSFGPIMRYDWSGETLFSSMPYNYVPINRVVRAPARFAMGSIVVFSVLAGFGVARFSGWLRLHYGRMWPIFNLGVIVLVALELHRPTIYHPIIKPNAEVETWLAQNPVGLTFHVPAGELEQDSRYEFYSTEHFQPLINGYSGYYNLPTYHWLLTLAEPVPDPLTLRMLQGLGLKYFITHTDDWSATEQEEAAKRLPLLEDLRQVASFGASVIYEVAPDPWMAQIEPFVSGKTLYVSNGGTLPSVYAELLALRFHTSVVAGTGLLGYRQLEPPMPGTLPDFGLFGVNEDPTPIGFSDSHIVWQNEIFKLIKRP